MRLDHSNFPPGVHYLQFASSQCLFTAAVALSSKGIVGDNATAVQCGESMKKTSCGTSV